MLKGGFARMKSKRSSGKASLTQRAFLVPPDVGEDPADREVHAGEAEGGVVPFLPIDGDVRALAGMSLDELLGLDEEAACATAGVIDPAARRLHHLDHRVHDGLRCVELAAALALGRGELPDEVFVDPADEVVVGPGALELDVREEVDEPGHDGPVQALFAVDLGERALERRVLGLDRPHGLVHEDADAGIFDAAASVFQRACSGTQKLFRARYSSRSSGSA